MNRRSHTDDEQPDPERPELETTTACGKPDGKRCYEERQNPEPGCEGTKDAHRCLHRFELVGVDELDASCGRRQLFLEPADRCDLLAELDDDRPQIQVDLPVTGADEPPLVLDEREKLLVGPGRDCDPRGLHARSLEEFLGSLVGRLPGERRERRRQRLLSLGEARGDPRLDVDVRVELLDGRESNLLANVVVLDQIGCDPLDPGSRRAPFVRG